MRVLHLLSALFLVLGGAAGCGVVAPVVPPVASVYTQFRAPLDVDSAQTRIGSKQGESSCISVLGLVAIGDASIHEAAQNGRLSVIHSADYSYMNVLWVFQRYATIVYGD
jgi:hypothetical protein